jgi:hypothetical protein
MPIRTIPQYFSREILETMLTSVRSGEISSTRNAAAPAVLTAAALNPRCRPYRQIRDGFNSTVNTETVTLLGCYADLMS